MRLPREHGTDRGYHQHRKRGELACDACLAGHSEYVKTRQTHREKRPRFPCLDCGVMVWEKKSRCRSCAGKHGYWKRMNPEPEPEAPQKWKRVGLVWKTVA